MKRWIVLSILGAAIGAGCSEPQAAPPRADGAAASAWERPPVVGSVMRRDGTLVVSGVAGPRARVVLRGLDGQAVAAAAGSDGRFDIRMAPPAGHALLTLEVQSGEEAFVAPARLLILNDGIGPVALLSAGQGAVRLDRAGPLDAVDSDGAALIVSGRAEPVPEVSVDGRIAATTIENGRWRAQVPAGAGLIRVGGTAYAYPGGATGGAFTATRAGEGWRVAWSPQAGAAQSVWLPDAP